MNMHPLIYEISYIYFLLLFLASTIPRAATPINAAFVINCVSTPVFTLPVFVLFVVVASFFFSSSFYESLHLLPVNFFNSPIRTRQTHLHESSHLLPVNFLIAYLSFSNSPALSRKYWSFFHISKWIANIMILFIIII